MRCWRGESVRRERRDSGTFFCADGNDAAILLFCFFFSFKLYEDSAALEDVRERFVSRHPCKSLHRLVMVVTGLKTQCFPFK